jgi:alpha-D-ribose 1-methylphosphonate 5-triphosphate diphosphatase
MAEAGICNVLSSDYFYPAMLRAAFVLAERDAFDLPRAWSLISTNPAAAARLVDRGAIADGLRADLVLVDPQVPRVVATITEGRIAHITAEGSSRLAAAGHSARTPG